MYDTIKQLRKLMERDGIDTYIALKSDPHQSEYAEEHWNEQRFLSGFSGSAGSAVITRDHAGLWTDGRYFIQAEQELDGSGFTLHKDGEPRVKKLLNFVVDETPKNGVIGFDGRCMSASAANELLKTLKPKGISLKTDNDLIGELWSDRPAREKFPIVDHSVAFCGKSRTVKIEEVRFMMREQNADTYVISSLDDIAWLFNLRGGNMKTTVLFSAYALITLDEAILFADPEDIKTARPRLVLDGIRILNYDDFYMHVRTLPAEAVVAIDLGKSSRLLAETLDGHFLCELRADITTELKAIKNERELECLEEVNIRDGVAMVRFLIWVEENKGRITEYDAGEKLTELRRAGANYITPSFDTIAGYNANAAMMHYSASKETAALIKSEGFLLVDSGGHYWDGTTDITRTIVLGYASDKVKDKMKRDFTLTLKAHIGLASAVFRYGAYGSNLDTYARSVMWKNHQDYNSGTGHGIGFCLSVHEGPQRIGVRPNDFKLEPGMIVTNEPGVYREGEYGIRTENTMLIEDDLTNEFGKFLRFKTISYCPIDLAGVEVNMLDDSERAWLNDYHRTVYEKLSPRLTETECSWLAQATHTFEFASARTAGFA
ncbi:MAG: aminopeptidase P family protein [Clostridiales bacterium]|nr:aminopeptidase P family protein [Clostridiales bacterium]